MPAVHQYTTQLLWTGNDGEGTRTYTSYDRSYVLSVHNKPVIPGSSDPHFHGDPTRYNPEELLVGALSSCHMLWFLHLCAAAGVVVEAYEDRAAGTMTEDADGSGRFAEVVLHPKVWIRGFDGNVEQINGIHTAAHQKCFIANSCNFPIRHEAMCFEADKREPF